MDAIDYLRDQHREILSLFDQLETAARDTTKRRLCRKLVDLLAVHLAIEERIFYPAAQHAAVEQLLPRAFEEHLREEHTLAEIMAAGGESPAAADKLALLKERKRQHADEEERELFPCMRELLSSEQLAIVGDRLQSVADELLGPGVGARERICARRALA